MILVNVFHITYNVLCVVGLFSDPLSNRCQQMICECDREIGQCFKQAIYNKSLDHWPNFRCKN